MADALHKFFPIYLFDNVPFFCISDINLILLTICTASVSLWLCGNQSLLIKLTHWGTIFDIFLFQWNHVHCARHDKWMCAKCQ